MTCRIIPFNEEHLKQTFLWIQDPLLRHDFLMKDKPTWKTHCAHFKEACAARDQIIYAIIDNDTHIGNCGLKHIIPGEEAELWIYLGTSVFRRKGVGTQATSRLIIVGGLIGLRRIYLHVADFNLIARRMYKSLGFQEVPLQDGEWAHSEQRIIRMVLKL
jgi:RimJ/RimL family protein N-acetyltransferase